MKADGGPGQGEPVVNTPGQGGRGQGDGMRGNRRDEFDGMMHGGVEDYNRAQVPAPGQRGDQVDTGHIEATAGHMDFGPDTLMEEKRAGGYQDTDQSYPDSPRRATAGTRGARDVAAS